jgi:adenine-specific DNA-methyltransferase
MATLNFKGKSAVWNHHLSVPYHTLEKDVKRSLKGENDSENLIIQGDNLLALKALLPQYQGKVKCIYIDPPYNTGNEEWVYSDNVSSPTIKEWVGKTVGKDGEDLTRHDKWLCMMTPRLKMLRELLADDGAIFVSIDDNEQHHLRSLMDEVFGEENFVVDLTWVKKEKASGVPPKSMVIPNFEYILVYKRSGLFRFKGQKRSMASYKLDEDGRYWRYMPIQATGNQDNYFDIVDPTTGKKYHGNWALAEKTVIELLKEGKLKFPKNTDGKPVRIVYADELSSDGSAIFSALGKFDSETATKEFNAIFGEKVFDFPKPLALVKFLVSQVADDALVLDSFAGSGTTAHAVLDLNKEDGGNRKCILVEMEDYADKITAERVRRVIKKEGYTTGFTYHTLGSAIDAENMLTGNLPSYKEFAKYVYYLATGKNHPDESKIKEQEAFVGKGENESIYAFYKPSMDVLKTLAITLDWAQETHKKDKGRKIVYAPACYLDDEMLDQYGIKFVSIPYNLFERQ